jgi:hypothetical protein
MRLAISRDQAGRCRGVSGWVGARGQRARTAEDLSREQSAWAPDHPNKFRRKSNGQSARVRQVAVVVQDVARGPELRECTVEGSSQGRKRSLRRPAELMRVEVSKPRGERSWVNEAQRSMRSTAGLYAASVPQQDHKSGVVYWQRKSIASAGCSYCDATDTMIPKQIVHRWWGSPVMHRR